MQRKRIKWASLLILFFAFAILAVMPVTTGAEKSVTEQQHNLTSRCVNIEVVEKGVSESEKTITSNEITLQAKNATQITKNFSVSSAVAYAVQTQIKHGEVSNSVSTYPKNVQILRSREGTVTKRVESVPIKKTILKRVVAYYGDTHDLTGDYSEAHALMLNSSILLAEKEEITKQELEKYGMWMLDYGLTYPTSVEIEAIAEYVLNGGIIIINGGDGSSEANSELSKTFGVNFTGYEITDETDNDGIPSHIIVHNFSESPIASNLSEVCMYSATSLKVDAKYVSKEWKDSPFSDDLVKNPNIRYINVIGWSDDDSEAEAKGPIPVLVEEKFGLGRVICVANNELWTNENLHKYNNSALLKNLLEFSIKTKPEVSIYTDKTNYTAGEKMHLGLDVNNPLDSAQKVSLHIYLELPTGGTITLIDTTVTLPAELDYSNPDFKVIKLPPIASGTYKWYAQLSDPITGEVICEDTAEWEFVSTGVPTEDITEVLEQTTVVIEFAD